MKNSLNPLFLCISTVLCAIYTYYQSNISIEYIYLKPAKIGRLSTGVCIICVLFSEFFCGLSGVITATAHP